jgi:hypothetical protein
METAPTTSSPQDEDLREDQPGQMPDTASEHTNP